MSQETAKKNEVVVVDSPKRIKIDESRTYPGYNSEEAEEDAADFDALIEEKLAEIENEEGKVDVTLSPIYLDLKMGMTQNSAQMYRIRMMLIMERQIRFMRQLRQNLLKRIALDLHEFHGYMRALYEHDV